MTRQEDDEQIGVWFLCVDTARPQQGDIRPGSRNVGGGGSNSNPRKKGSCRSQGWFTNRITTIAQSETGSHDYVYTEFSKGNPLALKWSFYVYSNTMFILTIPKGKEVTVVVTLFKQKRRPRAWFGCLFCAKTANVLKKAIPVQARPSGHSLDSVPQAQPGRKKQNSTPPPYKKKKYFI
ncbi:hypothetical protein PoB_005588600 [Plakobranchus ocellatus]|uniref:Uncharacterized protein n=1 Tax=Plakobranchus ocellatus TaxID=259542 RepID=A0AAV4C1Z2_9GAST|nr:hypothetical protein PoB_005588600 [Plakobranchus ocellatus]